MRDNPGGLLGSAIRVSGEFLSPGTVVLYEQHAQQQLRPYKVRNQGVALDIPLVVLVNERSASASEIVAGALKYHDRAIIIGQRTYGKGTVQLPHDMKDGLSASRNDFALAYAGLGKSISDVGISPAIEVEAEVTEPLEDDIAVQRALQELTQFGLFA